MKSFAFLALPLALAAAPALAGPKCTLDEGHMQMWQIAKPFEEAGGVIRQMKVSDNCYEIYGTEGDKKVEIYYDPNTGEVLEREDD
ncbi:MAG: PepSY domain-containing protein [Rhodobacteraceae bacterium]|nr:PepSY domain-containing protein [Paracoccaceae bacterium]